MAKANMAEAPEAQDNGDAPLIDLNDANIKKVIARAKKRGYITYDQLNDALPQGEMSSDQIEDMTSALNEMGIRCSLNVIAPFQNRSPASGSMNQPWKMKPAATAPTDRTISGISIGNGLSCG